tara:strand:- start:107 stop:361 length:255 start_codon:yes stop_codon:yes gene_type:complete
MKLKKWADALLNASGGAKYVPSIDILKHAGLTEAEAREFQQYLYGLGFKKLTKKHFYTQAKEWALSEYNYIKIRTILMGLKSAD